MMKLFLKSPFKSITLEDKQTIESAVFPDLVFITGKNGSGKTHLLEAINSGAIPIAYNDSSYPKIPFNLLGVGNIPIESGNISDYGPKMYVDYHNVSFKDAISYGGGINPLLKEMEEIQIQINHSFNLGSFGFNAIANDVFLVTRIMDKMVQSVDTVTSTKQLRDLGQYELRKIDEILRNSGHSNKIDKLCTNLLRIYTQHKDRLLLLKDKFPHISLETMLGDFYGKHKGFKENLYSSYKGYLRRRADMYLEFMNAENFPSNEEILERCGECPLDFLNRTFGICNYSFDTDQVKDEVRAVIQMNTEELSKYTPILKLKKDNLEISLDDISSGEKVILSLSLLFLENTISNGQKYKVLLLDEIETNLHPSMLQNFLDLIQDSFIKKLGLKIFLVTHSPSTIALAPEGSVFVMRGKDESGKRIEQTTNEDALNTLTEGFATLNKGIHLFDQVARKNISIVTEGNNTKYIKKALSFYYQGNDVGIVNGVESRTGQSQLKTLFQFFTKCKHDNKVIFVFDCDVAPEMSLKDENNTYAFIFENNKENSKAKKGIENLFPKEKFSDDLYKNYGRSWKNHFMAHILANGTKQDFEKFRPLIDKINEIKKGA